MNIPRVIAFQRQVIVVPTEGQQYEAHFKDKPEVVGKGSTLTEAIEALKAKDDPR